MSLIEKLNFLCINDEILKRFLEILYDMILGVLTGIYIPVMIYVLGHVKK